MADLTARIGADIEPLSREIKKAQALLRRFARRVGAVARRLAKFGAAVAAAGVAIGTVLVKKALSAIDSMSKLARQLGTTTESMGVLERAAELSGITMGDLEQATIRQNKVLGEAIRGYGTGAEALDRLGLSAEELSRLPLDERLRVIAQRMQELDLNAAQQADTLAQLGDRQGRLFNLMEDGAAVLERASIEARAFGLAVSDVDAAQIERANDALSTIGAVITGIGRRIAVFLAPFLEKIGDEFAAAAVESEGFKSEIEAVFDFMARAVGFVLDRLQDMKIAFKVLNTGVTILGDLFIQAFANVERALRGFFDRTIEGVNVVTEALSQIPGVEIGPVATLTERGFGQGIQRFALESKQLVAETKQDLLEALQEPIPSDSIEDWLAEVRRASRTATMEVVGQRQIMADASEAFDTEEEERAREKAERDAERRLQELDAFKLSLLSEEEAEIESHRRRLEELALFHEQQLVSEQEFMQLKERLTEEHEAKLKAIRERGLTDLEAFTAKSWRDQTATVVGELSRMTAGVAQQSKALFELNKVAAIAEAIIQAHLGISRTLAAYPFPLNVAMAAAHAAVAFARVVAIKNQQFTGSGGGAAPSVAGTTAATPVSNVQSSAGAAPAGQTLHLTLVGESFGRKEVLTLIEQINEAVGDGARIRAT